MIIIKTRTMFFAAIFFIFVLSGCEHTVDEPESNNGQAITFAKIMTDVFVVCTACHLNGATSGGLDLSYYENIVDAPSAEQPDILRIKPGDPDTSYLYMKVTGAEGITGNRMPLGGQLSAVQLELLRDWILSGAPDTATE